MPATVQGEVDAFLDRSQSQLLQPCRLTGRPWLGRKVGQRRPPPQIQRLGIEPERRLGVAGRCASMLDQFGEPVRIDLVPIDGRQVSRALRDHQRPGHTDAFQRMPEPRDPALQSVRRVGRRVATPQGVNQRVARQHPTSGEQQQSQHGLLARRGEGPRRTIDHYLQRPQQPELHRSPPPPGSSAQPHLSHPPRNGTPRESTLNPIDCP